MCRLSTQASALGVGVACAVLAVVSLAGPASAGGPGLSIKVNPSRGLVNGEVVTVSGHGLSRTAGGTGVTWFVTECTASVRQRMNPSTDTPYCDVTDAQAIRVSHNGSFSTKFRVRSGIVGDGYCGTSGHTTCVIGIGTARGQGTVVKITFASTSSASSTTTTTSTAG